jgi:hypothetical protein
MWQKAKRNFILQQGFEEPAPGVVEALAMCSHRQPDERQRFYESREVESALSKRFPLFL